jgi:hypothetical protein
MTEWCPCLRRRFEKAGAALRLTSTLTTLGFVEMFPFPGNSAVREIPYREALQETRRRSASWKVVSSRAICHSFAFYVTAWRRFIVRKCMHVCIIRDETISFLSGTDPFQHTCITNWLTDWLADLIVKLSPLQAAQACRYVRCWGSHDTHFR